ncbi:MAG: DUF917 domain-containing protein [Clostridiales Family XIII bacterium]|jgi:DUF917 family protein|nr:DUF917 domain-containing protein [Clostridiales Family XIII bacterium]
MSRKLDKTGLLEILCGAAYLAGGGGGSLFLGERILNNLENMGAAALEMFDVSEMEEDAYGAMAACLGSPKSVTAPDVSFADAVSAFMGLQSELKRDGKNLKYVYSGEYGGLNTCVAMYISIKSNTPLIDLDSNVRAVPELNTGLPPIYGFPPYPVILANEVGDVCAVRTANPNDSSSAEFIARQLCMAFNMKIGFSTWALSKDDIQKYLVPGTLTRAQKVGQAIKRARTAKSCPIRAIAEEIEIREICRGQVEKLELTSRDGFDFGITTVCAEDGRYTVHFKNENMVAYDPKARPIVTVPETIAMIDLDKYEPLTNADVAEGMNISVAAIPAQEPWWRIPEGFGCWKEILEKMGAAPTPARY